MGSRANILLIEGGAHTLLYCHWCAMTLPTDLFWGPEMAVSFALQQQPRQDGLDWLDDQWSEGGAAIDLDRRMLLFYGGDDILWDLRLRRLYLELLRQVWIGWQIRWALLGILDLVDYAGVPRAMVRTDREPELHAPLLAPQEGPGGTQTVGSILFQDRTLRLFPVRGRPWEHLLAGPRLLDVAQEQEGYDFVPLDEWQSWFPRGGFHIDAGQRLVEYWTADTTNLDPEPYIVAQWPGWQVDWLHDRYEAHLARVGGQIRLPFEAEEVMLSWLGNILTSRSEPPLLVRDPGVILKHVARMTGEDRLTADKHVRPAVFGDHFSDVPGGLRKQIFDRAVAAWRQAKQGRIGD
jgi:hypothetical protein